MGYRSDVGVALVFDSAESCDAFIMAYKVKEPEIWKRDVEGLWYRAAPDVMTGMYEDVKWYRGFADVDSVYEMLEFATENFTVAWRLVRIGEEIDDIEVESEWADDDDSDLSGFQLIDKTYDYVEVHRAVDINASGEPI